MILEDQTQQILELKHMLTVKDDEISKGDSKIDKIRQKYDKKIASVQSENSELIEALGQLKQNISDNEESIINLKYEVEKGTAEIEDLEGRLKERDEIILLVKGEILEIRKYNEGNQKKLKEYLKLLIKFMILII